jgi:hypothetical protein
MAEDITKIALGQKKEGKREVERNLTSQHLAGRLDNAKDKRIALLMMHNLRRQARHLIIKNRYLFCQTTSLLALSTAICAWRLAKVKRVSRSEILEEYSAH